jgi:DNA-binding GntR family transcriptional regulator
MTSLQRRVAGDIVALVRRSRLPADAHLAELWLAGQIGTSRSPVRAALVHLTALGLLRQDPDRGFFVAQSPQEWAQAAERFSLEPDNPLYMAIASALAAGELPEVTGEAALMRKFGVGRSTLRKVLARISEEGWATPKLGHGWVFDDMMATPESYAESYLFRLAIEPTGLLSPGFRLPEGGLAPLLAEQHNIADSGYRTMTPIELFEANSRFHESLAQWSGNRFIFQSVKRVNQLRRLVEYRQASKRAPRRGQASEHIGILEALARHDNAQAADLLRRHLEGARLAKAHEEGIFKPPPASGSQPKGLAP